MSSGIKDLGEPIRLPLSVAARVAWSSIKVRLSRSLVTVSSVILAVAFLLVVMGDDIASGAVYADLQEQTRPARILDQMHRTLTRRRPAPAMLELYRARPAEIRRWAAGLGQELAEPAVDRVADLLRLKAWVEELRPSQQYILVRTREVLEHLISLDEGARPRSDTDPTLVYPRVDAFVEAAGAIKGTLMPLGPEALRTLATAGGDLRALRDDLRAAETARLVLVKEAGGRDAILERIAGGEDPAGLVASGLPFDQFDDPDPAAVLPEVRARLRRKDDASTLQRILSAGRTYEDADGAVVPAKAVSLDDYLDLGLAAHPCGKAIAAEIDAALGERVPALKDALRRQRDLAALEQSFRAQGYDPLKTGQRTFWLIVLSFIVCVVGIVNSMMMSVTERFREIATMKCLGAVDGFILKTFLIESGSIGVVGAFIGSLLGILITVGQGTFAYGGSFWAAFPVGGLLGAMGIALVCGLFLTVLGALLPAYKAARMHPIEAMRLEG